MVMMVEKLNFAIIIAKAARCVELHDFEGVIPNMQRRYQETESRSSAKNWPNIWVISPARIVMVHA